MDATCARRRARLLESIGSGVLLLPAAPRSFRNADVEHEYRQDSDFHYLSGFDEPESVLVLVPKSESPFVLFVRPRDPKRETWDGPRAGVEGAVSQFGASAAFDIAELDQKLPELLQDSARLFYRLGRDRSFDDRVLRAIDRVRAMAKHGKYWPTEIVEPETLLHEMRLLKEPEELSLMRRALDITKEAHLAAMAQAEPGQYEYEIEALISSIFRKHGAERPAYPPIVGSGPNATILHYRARDRRVNPGDLLLIDAGCEYAYYASDVTRTFPASGEFSPCQRAIYEVVLDAQLAAIEKVRPGATLEEIHNAALGVVCDGLRRLGLLDGEPQKIMDEKRYKPYFMHRTSHYLGMDVHDAGSYFQLGKPRPLETGMVITVEPGVYISQSADQVPTEYRGIGVRIEDDVLVVPGGSEVLSDAIPKRVDEVERACRS